MAGTIDLVVTDEQHELGQTLRRFLADKAPLTRIRALADNGEAADTGVWEQIVDLGLAALTIPERFGGLEQGAAEAVIVHEALGAALYDGPLFATAALATPALLASGDEDASEAHLTRIAAGEATATLAVAGPDGRWDTTGGDGVDAAPADDGWALSGSRHFVVDGASADLLLVVGQTEAGPTLFSVEADHGSVTRTALPVLDPSRRLARIDLQDTPGRAVGEVGGAGPILDAVTDHVALVVAAEAVGGMRACLTMSTDHAKSRTQFGQPIGAFQAVAHLCVEMLRRTEFGAAAVQYAAAARDGGSDEWPLAVRAAAAYCGAGYHWVTKETIQVFGGLGFTWEHDAHLFYRRARSAEQLFTPRADHLEAVAARAGL